MENLRDSKTPKFKSLSRTVLPINMQNVIGRRYHHSIFDPYASDSSNSPSALAKYLRSTTPLAAIENLQTPPTVFRAPVKVEEDVLVMDGILIDKSNKSSDSGGVMVRSSLKSSDSRSGSLGDLISYSLSSSTSPGGGGSNGGCENNNTSLYCYQAENCRSCEDSARFGSKCQDMYARASPPSFGGDAVSRVGKVDPKQVRKLLEKIKDLIDQIKKLRCRPKSPVEFDAPDVVDFIIHTMP